MLSFLFTLAAALAPYIFFAFVAAGTSCVVHKMKHGTAPSGLANDVWRWTKWPAFAHLFITPAWALTHGYHHWYSAVIWALDALTWWWLRNAGDDDPGKKLKNKLKEKIEIIHGRLVIVPATT